MKYAALFIFVLAFVADHVYAAKVIKVSGKKRNLLIVTHELDAQWQVGQSACVMDGSSKVACGRVMKVSEKAAIIKIGRSRRDIYPGDKVRSMGGVRSGGEAPPIYEAPMGGAPPSEEPSDYREPPRPRTEKPKDEGTFAGSDPLRSLPTDHNWLFTGGFNVGFDHFIPLLHLQRMIGSNISLGIMPVYVTTDSAGASVEAFGGFITLDYHLWRPFRGIWVQLAGGAYAFSAKLGAAEQKQTVVAGQAVVGWREHWDFGLNLGIGIGGQYISPQKDITIVTIEFRDVEAVLTFDVGLTF